MIKQKKHFLYTSLASLTLAAITTQSVWAEEVEAPANQSTYQAETVFSSEISSLSVTEESGEELVLEDSIFYSTEKTHADKVEAVLTNRIQNGTLAFHVSDDKQFAPIVIEGEVGTKIDVTRTINFKAMIPYAVNAPKSEANNDNYDFGTLDILDPSPSAFIQGTPSGKQVLDYSKAHQFFQPDRTYLSGLRKQLADYGLSLEVADNKNRMTAVNLPGGFVDYHYKGHFTFSQTYRITGILRLPEGVTGQAESSWQNLFYDAKFSHRYGNGVTSPTIPAFPGSDYSDLSYNFTYLKPALPRAQTMVPNPDGTYTHKYLDPEETIEERTRWGSINFGVEEIPLVTTVRVKAAQSFADRYTINVTSPTVKIGTVIDPASLISNKTELPENTEFSWVNPPRTELPGTVAYNQIRISFADGSHKVVRVKVSVSATQAQLYIPEGLAQTFAINSSVSPEELIKNKGNLPENTRFTWALKPDLTRPGGKLARVNIIYPDGSIDEVVIRFVVR